MTVDTGMHEARIATEHSDMWAAYNAGRRDDARHHWEQIKRLISLRSAAEIDRMECSMGLTGRTPIATRTRHPFYDSDEWRAVRYEVLRRRGNRCQCCNRGKDDGAVIHVDHIKPRSRYPQLALDPDNCQVLCEDCNLGKSNRDETDWR